VEVGDDPGGDDRITVVPRSMIAALFYVSQAVEAPRSHENAGRVTVTRDADGKRFDWSAVTGELIQIRSSRTPPLSAQTRVFYRGSWFYVDDTDLASKTTFSLLMQLFALQSGHVKAITPILTIPVSD